MSLCGVNRVEQGFICAQPPNDSFSEAVVVHFDNDAIDQSVLIDIHIRTHASTSQHKMRGKYRSAIYAFDQHQADDCNRVLAQLQPDFDQPLVTSVLRFERFKASDDRFHNYYYTDPSRPFCTTYIDPKLALLRQRFAKHSKAPQP